MTTPGSGPSRNLPPLAFRGCSTCVTTAIRSSFPSGRSRAFAGSEAPANPTLALACERRLDRRATHRCSHGLGHRGANRGRDGVRTVAAGGDGERLTAALEREFSRGATAIMSIRHRWRACCGDEAGTLARRRCGRHAHCALAGRCSLGDGAGAASARRCEREPSSAWTPSSSQPAEKRALGDATGAIAVDTESHVVAAFAAAHGIPFAVFRVVADPVERAIAPAATRGMRSDGTVNPRAVLGSVVRTPHQLPALWRNAVDARTAFRALSRGRRLLGPGLGYPNLGQFLLDVS